MKKYLLRIVLSSSLMTGFAQAPAIKWQKSLGGAGFDKATSIQQTSDGGFIVAGVTSSTAGDITTNNGTNDYWVVKLDSLANITWQKTLGGSGDDGANAVTQTSDGGYFVVGSSNSPASGNITNPKGQYDVWVAKLTPSGIMTWQKSYGGTSLDEAYAVQQTTDGGYIIAGDSRSNNFDLTANNGIYDFWIIKIDAVGAIQWQKSLGGSGDDIARAIQQTPDGGYIVTGETNSNNADVSGNNGGIDYWVVKLSSMGAIQWQKCLGGAAADIAYTVKQTSDGGYVVGGKAASNNGNVTGNKGLENAWVVKLTSTGVITWQKCFGGNVFDACNSIQQTIDGGYIFAGTASSNTLDVSGNNGGNDYWVVKLNSAGTFSWQKCLGGSNGDFGACIQQTSDEGYVVAGNASSSNGDITNAKGLADFWVVRFKGVFTPTITVPTAINETNSSNSQFNIFPNPSNGIITVSFNSEIGDGYQLRMTDPLGRLVFEEKINEDQLTFDVSGVATKGIYFLSMFNKDRNLVEVQKIIVDR